MKSFSPEEKPIDIEDLYQMKCLNKQQTDGSSELGAHNVVLNHLNSTWYSTSELKNALDLVDKYKNGNYKLIAGNTAKGLYKRDIPDQVFININNVKELYEVKETETSLKIGANISLTRLTEIFNEKAKSIEGFEYLSEISELISKIGNTSVRNVGTWSGNLALKHNHQYFPSDLFVAFATSDAILDIRSANSKFNLNLSDFLKFDLKGHIIHSVEFKKFDKTETKIKFLKVMQRSQNSHAYVTGGFNFTISKDNALLKNKPRIFFSGVSDPFVEAVLTEAYLDSKSVKDNQVLQESLKILDSELLPNENPLLASGQYRKNLALGLYYKFILELSSTSIDTRNLSAVDTLIDNRVVSHGEQNFPSKPELFPLTKPIPRLNSYIQTTGEAVFNSDLPALAGQLNGALIISSVGRCKIESINIEKALQAPGVVKVVLAKDIPGENNISPFSFFQKEELFASDEVNFAGQPLGMVIAETERQARFAVNLVEVKYKDFQKPILTVDDAIRENSFHPKAYADVNTGNADDAIEKSPLKIEGEFSTDTQYHFYLENLIAISTPNENGYNIDCGSQVSICFFLITE